MLPEVQLPLRRHQLNASYYPGHVRQRLCSIVLYLLHATVRIQHPGVLQTPNSAAGLSMVSNACSWYLTDKVGRRPLTLWGVVTLSVVLMIMGGLAVVGSVGALKGAIATILLYCFIYNVTIDATTYNIIAEVSTSRPCDKTISVGIAFQYSLFRHVILRPSEDFSTQTGSAPNRTYKKPGLG
jgi:hypothetical protein